MPLALAHYCDLLQSRRVCASIISTHCVLWRWEGVIIVTRRSGAFLSFHLQTDAIDNHRSFHEKSGLTGKRELPPEDEVRPGERAWVTSLPLASQGTHGGGVSSSCPPT